MQDPRPPAPMEASRSAPLPSAPPLPSPRLSRWTPPVITDFGSLRSLIRGASGGADDASIPLPDAKDPE